MSVVSIIVGICSVGLNGNDF
uniref:Uncharacterized protein n=1 Tax=Rhizophora mucronata TaxID=61149 RepID=A0A2P2IKY7_RHIMU